MEDREGTGAGEERGREREEVAGEEGCPSVLELERERLRKRDREREGERERERD